MLISTNKDNWTEARDSCRSLDSHLAVITSQSEHDLIVNNIVDTVGDGIWIGGYYNFSTQSWSWDINEAWNYTNFAKGVDEFPVTDKGLLIRSKSLNARRLWGHAFLNRTRYVLCELDIL